MLTELIFAFVIVAICLVIHIGGVVFLAEKLVKWSEGIKRKPNITHETILLIVVVAIIIILHLTEAAIWAAFYQMKGLFPDYETSLYFSLGSYTTIGYGDVVLPQSWRLLGGIEGVTGVLLCGISTAFIFVILSSLFKIRMRRQGMN